MTLADIVWEHRLLRLATATTVPLLAAVVLATAVMPRGRSRPGRASRRSASLPRRARHGLRLALEVGHDSRASSSSPPSSSCRGSASTGRPSTASGSTTPGACSLCSGAACGAGLLRCSSARLGAALARRLHGAEAVPRRLPGRIGLWTRRTITAVAALGGARLDRLLVARPGTTPRSPTPAASPSRGASQRSRSPSSAAAISGSRSAVTAWRTPCAALPARWSDSERNQAVHALPLCDLAARDFVVVDWDQRGAGKSHSALEPRGRRTRSTGSCRHRRASAYLRERFDERRIYLAGTSWGSTLGVLAAAEPSRSTRSSAAARW